MLSTFLLRSPNLSHVVCAFAIAAFLERDAVSPDFSPRQGPPCCRAMVNWSYSRFTELDDPFREIGLARRLPCSLSDTNENTLSGTSEIKLARRLPCWDRLHENENPLFGTSED